MSSQRWAREVAGCVPVKASSVVAVTLGAIKPEDMEVLIVTSRHYPDKYSFPKGGWEEGERIETAAQREVMEEAGVQGKVAGGVLSLTVLDEKKKAGYRTVLTFFELRVDDDGVMQEWDEMHERERKWVKASEAVEVMATRPEMLAAIKALIARYTEPPTSSVA